MIIQNIILYNKNYQSKMEILVCLREMLIAIQKEISDALDTLIKG